MRFDDKNTRAERKKTDNMAAVREMFTEFVQNCETAYVPNEYLTIDEMLLAFRGKCSFRVYIPSKPAKYGIKIIAIVDAKTYYILKLEVYTGKQPSGPFAISNKAFDVVERIVAPISGTNRNVTFDNWFTSYPLMMHLLHQHKLTAVGTVRKNKTQVPEVFKKTGRKVFSSQFGFQKDVTLVSYAPPKNKVVLMMSTLHHDQNIDISTGEKKKPEIITFYNSTKAGVDVADELSATYDVSRNSKRWPMMIFYGLLNMAAINANIIYRENVGIKIKRREFIRKLGMDLMADYLREREKNLRIPRDTRKRIADHFGEPSFSEAPNKKTTGYTRCRDCPSKKDRKTKYYCSDCYKPLCMEHAIFQCKDCMSTKD